MRKKKTPGLSGTKLWSPGSATVTAERDLDIVLGSVTRLPLRYWRRNFFFFGLNDNEFLELTGGEFPIKLVAGKTHPVFCLKRLPDNSGFKVCPCSSKKPLRIKEFRYIQKGCRLLHTDYIMDRRSHLIEAVDFNIPPAVAYKIRFKGEVPAECLKLVSFKSINP